MNSKIESNEVQSYLKKEKVTFDAASGNERMIAYLYLPLNAKPPYQAIVYFPGADAQFFPSSENLAQTDYMDYIDFLIRNRRVVVYPMYKGTFERGGGPSRKSRTADEDREWRFQMIKDVSRTIDYLESRDDINKNKLTYYGYSWGAFQGSFVGAVEKCFQTMILLHGRLPDARRSPEIDAINFVPRVRMPVLMINGKYDHLFPVETLQGPMFQLLGTPAKDKAYLLFEGGHWIPHKEVIKVVLDWLDRYLGPVN
ncbi:MAG TPA: dienelactone hydrolase family protein [Acidobacteriota bacterium]|nr:dienelactone hydrolase family protein [Acidobacteriota bacterium]